MHPNEQLFRSALDALSRGGPEALKEYITEDMIAHVPGHSLLAGDQKALEYVGKLVELSEGTIQIEPHDVLANDDHVVALDVFRAQRKGKSIEYRGVVVYHVEEGKLAEAWINPEDQYSFDEFWS